MLITPDTRPFDFSKSDLVRSPGAHASDAYGDLYKFLEPKRYDHDGPPNAVLMALGTAWEQHFEYLLTANGYDAQRPGEFMSPEGIAYSPDLVMFDLPCPKCGECSRVGEIKLTSMDISKIPEDGDIEFPVKFDKYLAQIKLYADWLEWTHGWLAVVSIRQPWKPVARFFNLCFSRQELNENRRMILTHARHIGLIT